MISDDGRYVVFVTDISEDESHVYIYYFEYDMSFRVSQEGRQTQVGRNFEPSISVTGDYVAWTSDGYAGGWDGYVSPRVFVRQMRSISQCALTCRSIPANTFALNDEPGEQRRPQVFGSISFHPLAVVTYEVGQFGVAYESFNGYGTTDIVVHNDGLDDAADDHTVVVSSSPFGDPATGDSKFAAVGGEWAGMRPEQWSLVFTTKADNLGDIVDENGSIHDIIFVERTE